ncbi:MAG: glycosyltransferase [Calditrichota bacterium]
MTWFQVVLMVIFWGSFFLLIYNYFGFTLILKLLNLRPTSIPPKPPTDWELPVVTILMPVHNEAEILPTKLDNLRHLDYPPEKFEIIIASDQSTDQTVEIARRNSDSRIRVHEMERRGGKPGVIDALIPQVQGDIVIINDANVLLAPDAIRKIVALYTIPKVGCVCGNLLLIPPASDQDMVREIDYRNSEIRLKTQMDRLGRVIGAFGGFYSFRRKLFIPLGKKPCHDDVIIPLEILAQGYQVRFAAEAQAEEQTRETIGGEYRRRVRMSAFNILTLPRMVYLAGKSGILTIYLVFSYKVIRWISSFILAAMFISALILGMNVEFYLGIAILFGIGILCAVGGGIADRYGFKPNPARSVYHFAVMNLAAVVGLVRAIQGMPRYWTPQSRDNA